MTYLTLLVLTNYFHGMNNIVIFLYVSLDLWNSIFLYPSLDLWNSILFSMEQYFLLRIIGD